MFLKTDALTTPGCSRLRTRMETKPFSPEPCQKPVNVPRFFIDDVSHLMQRRVGTLESSGRFPQTVCQLRIPEGSKELRFEDQPKPLFLGRPASLYTLGDTGCNRDLPDRNRRFRWKQNCEGEEWPFSQLVQDIRARSTKGGSIPHVIHVGDYVYRCAAGLRCRKEAIEDDWNSWEEDFSYPHHRFSKQESGFLRAATTRAVEVPTPDGFASSTREPKPLGAVGWKTLEPFSRNLPGFSLRTWIPRTQKARAKANGRPPEVIST